jgi:hypothetical protein
VNFSVIRQIDEAKARGGSQKRLTQQHRGQKGDNDD